MMDQIEKNQIICQNDHIHLNNIGQDLTIDEYFVKNENIFFDLFFH